MQRFFGKSLIVIYAFAILPSVSAKADEALFIHGIQKDNRKEYVSSIGFGRKPDQMPYLRTWLYFPKTRELKTNNLIPDLKTRKQRDLSVIYPAASPQGRMLLLSYEIVKANNLGPNRSPVWSHAARVLAPSPFRNRPWNQNPPILTFQNPAYVFLGTETDPGSPFTAALWAPDGKRFLLHYSRDKSLPQVEIRHAGGGPLITLTDVRGLYPRWGNDSQHLAVESNDKNDPSRYKMVRLPAKNGTYSLPTLLRNAKRLPVQDKTHIRRMHFSPDGKQFATFQTSLARPRVDRSELIIGSLERPGVAWRVQGDYTERASGNGKTFRKEETNLFEKVFDIGWSQDSTAFYFIHHSQRKYYKQDIGVKITLKYQLSRCELLRWTAKTGVRKVMDLDDTPFYGGNPHVGRGTMISADQRYVAYWANPNSDKTKDWGWPGKGNYKYLVVADLTTKMARQVFHSGSKWGWAAFIKTQKDDPDRTRDDNNKVKPDLPQHFVEKNGAVTVVSRGTARYLRIPFRGRAFQFEGNWDQVKIEFAYLDAKGDPLKARANSSFRNPQGHVVGSDLLSHKNVSREGDHFSGVGHLPLSELNVIGDQSMQLQFRMSLQTVPKDKSAPRRTLVQTKPITVTLAKDEVPRLKTSEDSISFRTGKNEIEYLSWQGNIHSRGLQGRGYYMEMVVTLPNGKKVETRDTKYLAKDGHAAAIKAYRPKLPKSRFSKTRLSIPFSTLKLPEGTLHISVQLRARVGERYIATMPAVNVPITRLR